MTPANATDVQKLSPQKNQSPISCGALHLRTPSSFISKVPYSKNNFQNVPAEENRSISPQLQRIETPQLLKADEKNVSLGRYHHILENIACEGNMAEASNIKTYKQSNVSENVNSSATPIPGVSKIPPLMHPAVYGEISAPNVPIFADKSVTSNLDKMSVHQLHATSEEPHSGIYHDTSENVTNDEGIAANNDSTNFYQQPTTSDSKIIK